MIKLNYLWEFAHHQFKIVMRLQQQIFLLFFCFFFTLYSSAQTTQTFTSAGSFTWTAPIGVASISVECYGGGGGGGSYNRLNNMVVVP